jgi:tetratricopeptide (TPR) repeat protein
MHLQRSNQVTTESGRQARRRIAKATRKNKVPLSRTENIGAMVQVAEGMRLSGRFEEAENLWRQLLVDFPDQPQPYVGLGVLLSQLHRDAEAYELHKNAVTIAPNEFVAWRQFGLCLYNLRQFEAAVIAFKKAVALKPTSPDCYHDLGRALFIDERPDEALAAFDTAIELRPDYALAYLGKGVQYQTLGRIDEAKEYLNKTIELDPQCVVAHFRLASMRQSPEEADQLLQRLIELSKSAKLSKVDRAATWFSSASILERQKDFDGAFEHYTVANGILHEDHVFDQERFEVHTDETIAGFPREVFDSHKSAGSPIPSPIFIVGMPRSGTTLVEAIISSHPDVSAGGEERKMGDITDALCVNSGALQYPLNFPDMKPAHLLPFGTQYLSHMARLHPGAKRTTDKLPFNYLHLGIIAVLFPNATIIHCRRNPLDTCLSCYFQYFNEAEVLSFTNNLADLGFVYAQYERLMAHWHDVLPVKILDVQYEELTSSQEAVSRELVAHAGLEWDDTCLRFHEQDRPVNTASHDQVRQPIYTSSVEKWRNYEAHLGPLQVSLKRTP